jgi:general secretion pathway protein A
MIEGIENPKGLISITGEPGTGKTSLVHYFLNSLDEEVKAAFIFHTSISFRELLKNILLELDLEATQEEEKALVSQLQGYLHRLARDETVVVVIDEAQNLQEGVIEEVGRLSDLEGRLQIIFVGQPEFEGKICSERLKHINQKITAKRQIIALDKKQSAKYIDHRLKQAGSRSYEIFTSGAISLVTGYSRGIPRTINILCDNALQIGYTLFRERVDEEIILKAITHIEGPQKGIPNRLVTIVRELRLRAPGLSFFLRRLPFIVLPFFFPMALK